MISRDEKRRRIYSAVYIFLIHNNVFSQMKDFFIEIDETVDTCKKHALALVDRNARNVDVYRMREYAHWDLYQTQVVQRSMETMAKFMTNTVRFINTATESMGNMMNPTQMEFITHARESMIQALETRFEKRHEDLPQRLDPGAFLALHVTKPMHPMNAVDLREAIQSIDATKLAQSTLESPGSTTAMALKRLIDKELQTRRRPVEIRSVELDTKIGREYAIDPQMRARVADTTDELERIIITWCAACAQRVAVYYLVQPMMEYLASLRAQINDAVAEVLRDPKYGGEMVFKLIMSNDEEHELLLKVMERRYEGAGEGETDDQGEELGPDQESFARIMGDYADDELRGVYDQASVVQEVSHEEASARLEKMFRRGDNGSFPTLPVKVVNDAIESTLCDLVTTITARRLELEQTNEAVVNTAASIMLGIGTKTAKKRGRPTSSTSASSSVLVPIARAEKKEDVTNELLPHVDPDIVTYTNAELMRAILRRDILRTFEERVFNCIVSPSELDRARSSSVMTMVRGTKSRINTSKRTNTVSTRRTRVTASAAGTEEVTEETERNGAPAPAPETEAASTINYHLRRLPTLSKLAFCPNNAIALSRAGVLVKITTTNTSEPVVKTHTDITRTTILHSADYRR